MTALRDFRAVRDPRYHLGVVQIRELVCGRGSAAAAQERAGRGWYVTRVTSPPSPHTPVNTTS